MKSLLRLFTIMGSAWSSMVIAAIFGCLTIGSNMGLLAVSAYLISSAALHPSITELSVAIVGVRFFGISRALFRYLERYISHDATFRLLGAVRVWFYTRLERLAPARLMEWQSGELLGSIIGDVETLKEFYLRVIAPPVIAVVILSGTCLYLAKYSMNIVYVLMGGFSIAGVVLPLFIQNLQKHTAKTLVAMRSELKAAFIDTIGGIVELAAFGKQEQQVRRISQINQRLLRLQSTVSRLTGISEAFGLFIVNATVWLVLWFTIPLVQRGEIHGVYLAVIVLIVQSSFEAVLPLPLAIHYLAESIAAAKRLFAMADMEPTVVENGKQGIFSHNKLEWKEVSFQYGPEEPFVLDRISFSLEAGQRLAIVGPSGAGKSTLLHLLLRFWDYQKGSIRLDDHELKEYSGEELRRIFGVVSQKTHLFNASIRDNILLAKPDASERELTEAMKRAELSQLLKALPQGADTMVGQNGYALSGGERQRIAIARALLKNSPILILDEPAVGLDALTEELIMKTIEQVMEGRTTMMITHRLTGLEMMDHIMVFDKGRIVEQGKQDELLAKKGLFYQLWHLQHDVL